MPELDLMPIKMERQKAPHLLDPSEARILQGVDIQWLYGRLMRGPGVIDTQIANSASPILSAFVAIRRDCRRMVIDSSLAGAVRCTVGNFSGLVCTGPVNEWADGTDTETTDEDAGVAAASESCVCCGCCCGCCCGGCC